MREADIKKSAVEHMWMHATQMRDVATRAQVALGTIYRYFSSKDELLAAAFVEWAVAVEQRITARPPRGRTCADRLVDVLRRASRSVERDPNLTAAFVTAIASPDPAVAPWQHEMAAVLVALVSDALSGVGLEERNGIVRVLSWVWFGALLGWVNGWTDVGTVGDELAGAARLLVRPGG